MTAESRIQWTARGKEFPVQKLEYVTFPRTQRAERPPLPEYRKLVITCADEAQTQACYRIVEELNPACESKGNKITIDAAASGLSPGEVAYFLESRTLVDEGFTKRVAKKMAQSGQNMGVDQHGRFV